MEEPSFNLTILNLAPTGIQKTPIHATATMSCLSGIRLRHHFERSSLPNITHAPRAPWKLVGPASAHLQSELETLYWYGVRLELENTIRTLKTWQQSEYTDVAVDDEHDNNLHGFDTFIDQVTQETRAFAIRYGSALSVYYNQTRANLFCRCRGRENCDDSRPGQDLVLCYERH